jgi:hypothetical protein
MVSDAAPGQRVEQVRCPGGKSMASTMDFAAVAGLAMGMHNDSLDPGVAEAARSSTESFDPCQNPIFIHD